MHPSAKRGAAKGQIGSQEHGSEALQASEAVSDGFEPAVARGPLTLSITPERALYALLAVIAVLLLGGTLHMIAYLVFKEDIRLFDLAEENNIPSYFSALQLLVAAFLLGVIARHEASVGSPWRRHFLALAIGFAILSIDEAALIHETVLARLGETLLGDTFHFTWLGPGIVIVALVALYFLRFLLALPRRFGALFVASGAVFVAGAIGAEWVGSEISRHLVNDASWTYQIQVLIEEGLEMAGIALFIYALLLYIAEARIELVARVRS